VKGREGGRDYREGDREGYFLPSFVRKEVRFTRARAWCALAERGVTF